MAAQSLECAAEHKILRLDQVATSSTTRLTARELAFTINSTPQGIPLSVMLVICCGQAAATANSVSLACNYESRKRQSSGCSHCRASAAAFLGTHDFTAFSNKPYEPGANGNPVKHVVRCDILQLPHGFRVEVHASGFLYRQVGRHIAWQPAESEVSGVPQDQCGGFLHEEGAERSGFSATASTVSCPLHLGTLLSADMCSLPWQLAMPCSLSQHEACLVTLRQVRHMVGALLCGLSPEDIARALARGSTEELGGRYRGWQAAPACGLCLEEVYF